MEEKANSMVRFLKLCGGVLLWLMMLIGGSVVIVAVTDLMTEGESISIFFAVFGVAFFNGALFLYGKLLGSMKKAMKRVGIVAGILAVLFLFAATGEPTEPLEKEEAVS